MTKEEISHAVARLRTKLTEVCKNDGIEFESDDFYQYQAGMIAGFIAAVNEVPVELGIAIMARRPIVEPY